MKPLESPILPRYPNDNSGQAYYRSMDNGHVIRTFFKNIPNNWRLIWADGSNKLWGI
jgi:hypothetical protein